MTIHAIKEAILALPEKDRLELETWLANRWDSQMEHDFSPGGRGARSVRRQDLALSQKSPQCATIKKQLPTAEVCP